VAQVARVEVDLAHRQMAALALRAVVALAQAEADGVMAQVAFEVGKVVAHSEVVDLDMDRQVVAVDVRASEEGHVRDVHSAAVATLAILDDHLTGAAVMVDVLTAVLPVLGAEEAAVVVEDASDPAVLAVASKFIH